MVSKNQCIIRNVLCSWGIPVLFALFEGVTHFGIWHCDSSGYISIVKLFRGTASAEEANVIRWHGILRPIVPSLALPLSYVMSYRDAVAFVNLGFFLLGTFFTYLFAKRLFGEKAGFASAMCFASAAPNLAFGVAVLTDGAAYGVEILVLYYLLFVFEEKKNLRTSLSAGILIALAILTKETNIVILLFLGLRFLLHRDRLNVSKVFIAGIIGVAIPLAWSMIVGYNYLSFYGAGLDYHSPGYKGALLHPTLFLVSIAYAFFLCIPFAFTALFTVDDDKFKIFCEILISVGALLVLWPTYPESRFTFLTFPAVLPLAASGAIEASQILGRRPWFRLLSKRSWLMLIIVAIVAYTNLISFRLYFRTPLMT